MGTERKSRKEDRGGFLKHSVDQLLMKDQLEQGRAANAPTMTQKRDQE